MSAQYAGGSTISAGGLAWKSSVTGDGVDPCGESLTGAGNGGGCVANGLLFAAPDDSVRVNEINNGVIPHALMAEMNFCTSGEVYPGNTGFDCSTNYSYTGPPMGARSS